MKTENKNYEKRDQRGVRDCTFGSGEPRRERSHRTTNDSARSQPPPLYPTTATTHQRQFAFCASLGVIVL